MIKNSKKRIEARREERERRREEIAKVPPPFESTPLFVQTLRYITSQATSVTVTAGEVVCACGAMGTVANTTMVNFFAACRIKSVSVWVYGSASGANNTASLDVYGSGGNHAKEKSVTSYSPSVPSYMKIVPKPGDQAYDMCLAGNSTPVLGFSFPSGTVILDIHVVCYPYDTGAGGNQLAATTVVVGAVYWPSLDNTSGSDYFQPVGRPTTT